MSDQLLRVVLSLVHFQCVELAGLVYNAQLHFLTFSDVFDATLRVRVLSLPQLNQSQGPHRRWGQPHICVAHQRTLGMSCDTDAGPGGR